MMTLNDIVTLLKEGLDKHFFDLDRTVWISEFSGAEDSHLQWQIAYASDELQDRLSDVDAVILQTLVRHSIFSEVGDNWYRINPNIVETIYDQLNRRR